MSIIFRKNSLYIMFSCITRVFFHLNCHYPACTIGGQIGLHVHKPTFDRKKNLLKKHQPTGNNVQRKKIEVFSEMQSQR